MWGLWRADRHLIGVEEGGTLFLLGTDRLGRDMLSRIIHGARISLTVGLLGITVSFVLALVFGGLSGYYGGTVDIVIQRLIEVIRAFPELPLWMALSAALPPRWDPILVYVGITVILGVLEWTGLARSVRGKLLAVREEDFATAAVLMGGTPALHHPPASPAGVHEPPDRVGDPVHPPHDPRRDGAVLPRDSGSAPRSPAGACSCPRRRT